jgi:hypothetical protein
MTRGFWHAAGAVFASRPPSAGLLDGAIDPEKQTASASCAACFSGSIVTSPSRSEAREHDRRRHERVERRTLGAPPRILRVPFLGVLRYLRGLFSWQPQPFTADLLSFAATP